MYILLKITLFTVLKNQVIIIFGYFDANQPYNIRMFDFLRNFDLSIDEFHHRLQLAI
jgi:hypothetical protein